MKSLAMVTCKETSLRQLAESHFLESLGKDSL